MVAHGGVDMEPVDATFLSLEAATTAALAELARGTDGITAALASVAVLEDDPRFNAGYGSVLTRAMTVETDGAVSSGRTGRFAGVGAVPGIRRPAALAHRIMQQEEVVLLVGTQAAEYAASLGIEIEDLVTPEQLQALRTQTDDPLTSVFTGRGIPSETVGCLTIDRLGEVSSASSTGGLLGKPPGRVGDACIPGGGYWTDERFGVLCSGSGEAAMSINLARTVATRAVEEGLASALENSLRAVTRSGRAVCAIVAVDALTGEVMTMHNGSSFPVSVRNDRATYRLGDPTREQSDERSRR
ncbi:isoaspartyl peptidase/L-asparaginase [Lysinimonas soli]|uniref:Isoaspartyl peptidase/L-asparaginase n=1 Tax=Lysinimonas soli TaxID=1074233 RepID=A0ABW0NWI8_9MICO